MKTIKGDLILDKDTVTFNEDLRVEGNITSKDYRRNLIVKGDITARNITARNITARNITAWDINAGDIDAWNITAWNISYYAVCFAYKNIKCKSIKGRRENCKHFVLDGKIELKKEKE